MSGWDLAGHWQWVPLRKCRHRLSLPPGERHEPAFQFISPLHVSQADPHSCVGVKDAKSLQLGSAPCACAERLPSARLGAALEASCRSLQQEDLVVVARMMTSHRQEGLPQVLSPDLAPALGRETQPSCLLTAESMSVPKSGADSRSSHVHLSSPQPPG